MNSLYCTEACRTSCKLYIRPPRSQRNVSSSPLTLVDSNRLWAFLEPLAVLIHHPRRPPPPYLAALAAYHSVLEPLTLPLHLATPLCHSNFAFFSLSFYTTLYSSCHRCYTSFYRRLTPSFALPLFSCHSSLPLFIATPLFPLLIVTSPCHSSLCPLSLPVSLLLYTLPLSLTLHSSLFVLGGVQNS